MPTIPGFISRYFTKEQREPSRTLSRDAPSVIRARIASVSLTCVACSTITFVILTSQDRATTAEALHALGYWPLGLVETARCLLLTAILFAGPLYERLVVDEGWRDWLSLKPLSDLFGELTTWRNIVAASQATSPYIMMRNIGPLYGRNALSFGLRAAYARSPDFRDYHRLLVASSIRAGALAPLL
ncbi:hypothetical protein Daesc_005030 [Daldinia eschscholtzii]|uniref:Uncharacterized protein n=1 Tax=Daldinia eschscholtzii TaxID=292717 RepID=A0AAX6MJT5_9PEZI